MKEKAKAVRKEIKRLGYSSRRISVRSDYNSLNVTIKDLTICAEDIEKITNYAEQFEKIDRCERTYEILSGGNSFVFVDTDWEAKIEEGKKFIDQANEYWKLYESLKEGYGERIFINENYKALIFNNRNQCELTIEKLSKPVKLPNGNEYTPSQNIHRMHNNNAEQLAGSLAFLQRYGYGK